MKKRLKAFSRTTIALLTAALVCSPFTKAYADDTVDSLEKQTNGLQNQLDSLNQDLTSLSAEITDLASKIEDTDASVQKAELDLAAAKLDEQLQYDAMKKRIKYMYETGNTSLLQIIFSSESMGDFLNKAEFVKNITEYDRNMLDELQKVHELVAKKDSDLKAEQASLAEMKTNLDQQEQELNDKISSTSGELQASSEALAKAKEAQAAAAAALKKKQEEEAAEQQRQAKAAQTAANNTSSSSGNTDSGSSGGNTTITVPDTPAETTDLVLFAAILQCEAGGYNYDGILAVATVIMNRVASPLYPNTISGVVYQSGQFAPTWDGSLSRVLQRGPVSLCYQVAQEALGGARLASVSGCYQFRAQVPECPGSTLGEMYFSKSCPSGCAFDSFTGQNAKKRYLLIFTSKYRFLFSTHYSLQETVLSIPHNLPHLFHLLPLQACAYNEAGLIPIPSVRPDLKNESYLHPYN